jgi:hypothetical protein
MDTYILKSTESSTWGTGEISETRGGGGRGGDIWKGKGIRGGGKGGVGNRQAGGNKQCLFRLLDVW